MHKYILLSQSNVGGKTLQAWTRLLALPDHEGMVAEPIVFDERSHRLDSEISLYDYFAQQIELRLDCVNASRVTVLVDAIRPDDLSLVRDSATWDNLVAMLVVTFPELRWVFTYDGLAEDGKSCKEDRVVFSDDCSNLNVRVFDTHNRYSVFGSWNEPLFDPTGLREWIRWRTNEDLKRMSQRAGKENKPFQLPVRNELAAVIEDEFDYALIHGFAAYRFGFRTDIVTSWGQMKDRFLFTTTVDGSMGAPVDLASAQRHKYRLIFEDMRLQFADKNADIHLSSLTERGVNCNRLSDENDSSDFRFMISTGQESGSDDLWASNEGFLYNKRHGLGRLLSKPIGGPLELWRATGLKKLLNHGKADGFVSPPTKILDNLYSGHGAPGKLALVAGKLIERARRVTANANSPSGFILSAVLANDAFELLGGKTPTMSMEALKIKHVAEVRAECAFVGAGFHFDLNDRFAEIYEFVHSTCRWYHPSVRKYAELDARATIFNELVKVYSEAGQAEERDACLAEFRWNNRRLELLQAFEKWRPISVGANCVLLYAELLLVRMTRIVAAFVLWIAFFWLVTHFAVDQTNDQGFAVLLATQLDWMVGGGASGIGELSKATDDDDRRLAWISIASNVIGVFHFGILMSFLYSLISRK